MTTVTIELTQEEVQDLVEVYRAQMAMSDDYEWTIAVKKISRSILTKAKEALKKLSESGQS